MAYDLKTDKHIVGLDEFIGQQWDNVLIMLKTINIKRILVRCGQGYLPAFQGTRLFENGQWVKYENDLTNNKDIPILELHEAHSVFVHMNNGVIICKYCGKPAVARYDDATNIRMIKEQACFEAIFWLNLVARAEKIVNGELAPTEGVRISGHHYAFLPGKSAGLKSLLGFSGREFRVQLLETNEVFYTNNLWHQGKISTYFADKLPDNAQFLPAPETGISLSVYETISPDTIAWSQTTKQFILKDSDNPVNPTKTNHDTNQIKPTDKTGQKRTISQKNKTGADTQTITNKDNDKKSADENKEKTSAVINGDPDQQK